jgi:hypothetical protein
MKKKREREINGKKKKRREKCPKGIKKDEKNR